MGKTLERKVGSIEVERGLEARYPVSTEEQAKICIKKLKDLERKYESNELSADLVYIQLKKLDRKFEIITNSVSEEVNDNFYGLYLDLEAKCNEDMEIFAKKIKQQLNIL